MRVVGLISGGKDSCYNLLQCVAAGHTIKALANLSPKNTDELDSYMYQSVGHMGVDLYAEAMGIPLFRREIEGTSKNTKSIYYSPTEGDEVEDLFELLLKVKNECNVDAVSVGAVLSNYQRIRVENVCERLGLVCLAYLWRRDQSELLKEMIDCGLEAILIKVAAVGLTPSKHLGKTIKQVQPYLEELKENYNVHVCGEGGEYETFTLDCPLFMKKIVVEKTKSVLSSGDVGYLNLTQIKLVDKNLGLSWQELQRTLPSRVRLKTPMNFLLDLQLKEEEQQAEDEAKENYKDCAYRDHRIPTDDVPVVSTTMVDEPPFVEVLNGYFWTSVHGTTVHAAMEKLKQKLVERDLGLEDIVNVKMLVKSMEEYPVYNKEYISYFSTNPPTRVCVQIPMDGDVNVCFDVLLWKCPKRSQSIHGDLNDTPSKETGRDTLHVQSVSHWAPANIGPYSQVVKIGNLLSVAGMIGLVPGSMEMVEGGAEMEARLSLRHVTRVLEVVSPKSDIRSVVQGVCYVTDMKDIAVAKRMMARVSESQISTYVVVPALPRKARIEWQTWAHISNNKFDYDERAYSRDRVSVTMRRRVSHDNSVCALISTVSCIDEANLKEEVLDEMNRDCLKKMTLSAQEGKLSISLVVYYKYSVLSSEFIVNVFQKCPSNVSKFYVPVLGVEDKHTLISAVYITH